MVGEFGMLNESRIERTRRPAEDLWLRTLSQIPSSYGRLVYLSDLRDDDSATYRHHGLAMIFGEEEAALALAESHMRVFRDWLVLGLEQQKADLLLYMAKSPVERRVLVDNWLRLAPYRNLLPLRASQAEGELFVADLETLLILLRNACDASAPAPGDSPRR
jgi:hypothetical protein